MAPRQRPTEVTDHAVERYIQRWRPDIALELERLQRRARLDLETLAKRAEFTGENDLEQRGLWKADTIGGPILLCEQAGKFSTVLPAGSKPPNRRPRK